LFDETGRLRPELAELAPTGDHRMSANPHTNGGLLLRDLDLPDFRMYAVTVPTPGAVDAEATRIQGEFVRDVIKLNPATFRVFSPDETASNRWGAVFEATNRCSTAEIFPGDDHVSPERTPMRRMA
jgi:xylulose-5-phosphate/fructose-6-phosphate phosphoketolase